MTKIINGKTLEQYNKKYRNRRHRLLKYTKKQVEDFDKEYGHYIFNNKTYNLEYDHYLLKDRKWWFTKEDECYHEIPRPIRFAWFRNLNTGVQIATCVLLAGAVAGSTVAITQKIIYDLDDSIVLITDLTGKVNLKGKGKDNQINCWVYYLETKYNDVEIIGVKVKKGTTDLIEGEEFIYDDAARKVYVYIDPVEKKKISGKINIIPIVKEAKKDVTQGEWLVEYKKYSDRFQGLSETNNNELKQYSINDISLEGFYFNDDGVKTKPVYYESPLSYSSTGVRTAVLKFKDSTSGLTGYQKTIGGGNFAYSNIVKEIFNKLENECDIEYVIGDGFLKYNAFKKGDTSKKLYSSVKFNPNGYIENTYTEDGPKNVQFFIKYKNNPTLDDKYTYQPTNAKIQGMNFYYYFEADPKATPIVQNEISFIKGGTYTFSMTIKSAVSQQKTYILGVNSLDFATDVSKISDYIESASASLDKVPLTKPTINDAKIELAAGEQATESADKEIQFTFKVKANFKAKLSTSGTIFQKQ